jgi:ribosomal protein S18 acetylase RimI-like enzyme
LSAETSGRSRQVEIRDVRPGEYEEAGRVTADAYREFVPASGDTNWDPYLRVIADVAGRAERTTVLVALDGNRIVGSATVELETRIEPDADPPLEPGEAHIRMLGVAPEARGRGIGPALMAACEARARTAAKDIMRLHTTPKMTTAQRMYATLGYSRGDDWVLPDGFRLLSYSKRLA